MRFLTSKILFLNTNEFIFKSALDAISFLFKIFFYNFQGVKSDSIIPIPAASGKLFCLIQHNNFKDF